jgi:GTPase SAR1 family protein
MRRISRKTWLLMLAVAIALLSELAVLLNSIATGALVSSWPALVAAFIVTASIPILLFLQEWLNSTPEARAAAALKNRQRMLDRVQNEWITGFLENPLYYGYDELLLPLALRERVGSRFDLVLSDPLKPTHPILPGTTIMHVFDQAGSELLILGEPGAGKTTLLLELARDLLKRAKDNKEAPIPVVFMLASWATEQLPLDRWIVEELRMKYNVPSQIGEAWVKANQLLILLDGLDEMTTDALPACIEAINEYYHQAHRTLVVSSRTKEFLDQPGRLALHTAVTVQPLSPEQIDTYLDDLAAKGEEIEGLKRALHQSATLRAVAITPLYLTVLILAYHGKPAQELLELVEAVPTDQQHLLFHNYVEQMLQRKGTRLHATVQQTKHWLAWLACQLTARSADALYLERLQPDWLPKGQRAFCRWSTGTIIGLVFGLLGLGIGLIFGLLGLGIGLIFGFSPKIKPVEALTWSWVGLFVGLFFVLGFGLLGLGIGLIHVFGVRLFGGLFFGLFVGLFFGLLGGLAFGTSRRQLTERSILSPNEGIRRSVKNGLILGLVVGLVVGLFVGQLFGPVVVLSVVLFVGLAFGLIFGLGATVQHYTLRFWLWRTHHFPWQAVPFLDDAVEQLLLRRVGGGYIFRHRLLQDYFASLDPQPTKEAPTASASLQKPDEKE